MSSVSPEASPSVANPLGIRVIDHLKYYVDDVDKWAEFHERQLGMFRRAVGNSQTGLEGHEHFLVAHPLSVVCQATYVFELFVEFFNLFASGPIVS